jgi:hypothetical protein
MARDFGLQETLLAGPSLVTVDTTAGGKSLATLLGANLNNGLTRLVLLPSAAGIYFASGSASASSAPLPAGGLDVPIRIDQANLLRFYGSSIGMTVMQIG